MTKKQIYTLLSMTILLPLFTSCSTDYKVEGKTTVTLLDGKMLYLKLLQGNEWVAIDSSEVLHGCFAMQGKADSVRMAMLYMAGESIMPLVLERGKIKVDISHSDISAQGTPLNDQFYEFINKRNEMEASLAELERRESRLILEGKDIDEVRAETIKEGEQLLNEMNSHMKQFITENFENVLGPAVFMMMCNSMPYPIMTPEIEEIIRTAPLSFKDNSLIKEFLGKAEENMQLIEEQHRIQENTALTNMN